MTPATDFERLVADLIDAVDGYPPLEAGVVDARAAVIAAYNELAAECMEQARLNGMGASREARLMARLAECEGGAP